jgi:hypothetical protein
MCTSVIPLQSKGSVISLTLYERKRRKEWALDGVGKAVCAQNNGYTSVHNQSVRDREAVLHVMSGTCADTKQSVYCSCLYSIQTLYSIQA